MLTVLQGDKQILLAIVVGLLGFAMGLLSELNSMDFPLEAVTGPLMTLVAAFFGAWYAFKLHDNKDKRKRTEHDVKAANRAIFEISRHCNRLATYRKQFLEGKRNDPYRDYSILPVAGFSWENPEIDYDSLFFLFESSELDLVTEISSVEQEIISAVDVIRQRSEFHVKRLQPVIEKLEKQHGPTFSPNLISSALGPKDSRVLRMLTDYNYTCVDSAITEMQKVMEKLAGEVRILYPGHVVISFKL